MSETFTFTRMRFSLTADNQIRTLAARTQLRPNVICRIALLLSLESNTPLNLNNQWDWSGREINRGTLLGEIEFEIFRLVIEWIAQAKWPESPDDACVLHIHRGLQMLHRSTSNGRGVARLFDRLGTPG